MDKQFSIYLLPFSFTDCHPLTPQAVCQTRPLGMFMTDKLKKSFVIFFLAESRLLLSVTEHKYLSSVL